MSSGGKIRSLSETERNIQLRGFLQLLSPSQLLRHYPVRDRCFFASPLPHENQLFGAFGAERSESELAIVERGLAKTGIPAGVVGGWGQPDVRDFLRNCAEP